MNVVDEKEACSFLFPALVKEGKLTVGISTEGARPPFFSSRKKAGSRRQSGVIIRDLGFSCCHTPAA